MFKDDTIAAISTPIGEGGIGIIRLSGKDSVSIVEKIFYSPKNKSLEDLPSHKILYGFIKDPLTDEMIDEILVTVMRSPHTYTKEDVVEINCHSGMLPLRKILELVLKEGARLADPGEFTMRAFINGRLDLSQAEAVLDLIRAKTDESRRIAIEQLQGGLSEKITIIRDRLKDLCVNIEAYIDFPEEDIEPATKEEMKKSMEGIKLELLRLLETYKEARFFREGLSIAIVGRPNVGKSSLLNALLRKDRAIVTPLPGTTRDVIEEYLNIRGLPVRIMDTAGIRKVHDIAEREGVKRSLQSIENADLVIAIFDGSEKLCEEDLEVLDKTKDKNALIVINKCDLPHVLDESSIIPYFSSNEHCILCISATRGDGIEELKSSIFNHFLKDWKEGREGVLVTNIRHKIAIENALSSLGRALSGISEYAPIEIIAFEIRDSLDSLGEIIGAITTDDILDSIFKNFCIGK
ncbi:MAG: tRNA uridine-5-carboxymethylaminomethyl(34) synthesis GTPase MnmE [Nitrospirae bacterium]|nr:tRNA uridine-5-carboxymethylaminomethyl(34) synthesis GTPase MnmE [Nitrospirota bacterium]